MDNEQQRRTRIVWTDEEKDDIVQKVFKLKRDRLLSTGQALHEVNDSMPIERRRFIHHASQSAFPWLWKGVEKLQKENPLTPTTAESQQQTATIKAPPGEMPYVDDVPPPAPTLTEATPGQLLDALLERMTPGLTNLIVGVLSSPEVRYLLQGQHKPQNHTQKAGVDKRPHIVVIGVRNMNHKQEIERDFPNLHVEFLDADVPGAYAKRVAEHAREVWFLVDNVNHREANRLRDEGLKYERIEASIGTIRGRLGHISRLPQ